MSISSPPIQWPNRRRDRSSRFVHRLAYALITILALLVDLPHRIQDTAGFDRLSPKILFEPRSKATSTCYHALAADA